MSKDKQSSQSKEKPKDNPRDTQKNTSRDNPRDVSKDKVKDLPKDKPKEKDTKSKSEDHFIFNSTDTSNIDYAEFNDANISKSPIDGARSNRTDKPKSKELEPRAHCSYKEPDSENVLFKKSRSKTPNSIVMDKKTLKTLIKKAGQRHIFSDTESESDSEFEMDFSDENPDYVDLENVDEEIDAIITRQNQQTNQNQNNTNANHDAEADRPENDNQNVNIDVFEILQPYQELNDVGPPMAPEWANVVNIMAKGDMKEQNLMEKMQRHKKPSNVDVQVPKVNPEIWESVSKNSKIGDCYTQKSQKILLTAANVVCKIISECALRTTAPVFPELLKLACDANGLILKANYEINMERRRRLTDDRQFNYRYKHLKSSVPVTSLLFGDDLKNACANIDTQNKIGQQVRKKFIKKRRFHPYHQNGRQANSYRASPYRRRSGDYQHPRTYAGRKGKKTEKRSEKD